MLFHVSGGPETAQTSALRFVWSLLDSFAAFHQRNPLVKSSKSFHSTQHFRKFQNLLKFPYLTHCSLGPVGVDFGADPWLRSGVPWFWSSPEDPGLSRDRLRGFCDRYRLVSRRSVRGIRRKGAQSRSRHHKTHRIPKIDQNPWIFIGRPLGWSGWDFLESQWFWSGLGGFGQLGGQGGALGGCERT